MLKSLPNHLNLVIATEVFLNAGGVQPPPEDISRVCVAGLCHLGYITRSSPSQASQNRDRSSYQSWPEHVAVWIFKPVLDQEEGVRTM